MGRLLAVSTLLVASPQATANHVIASVIISRTPVAASHSSGVALGSKPTSRATPRTAARLISISVIDG